jgi:hypothetical protein
MNPRILASLALLIAFAISGCVSSDVISAGPDTYMVTASGAGFSTAGVREKVYAKANAYCASRGLVMVPVSFKARPGQLGRNPPSADLVFRALKPGDPAIERPMISESDEAVDVNQNVRVVTRDETKKEKDVYTELMKLDDLRKKGIITDEEFQAQKAKLLK